MSSKVSDFIIQRLADWGVNRIYGYPGDGINSIITALDSADKLIEFIQVRHEEMSAFMACAHAKFTGEVGVCLATGGPGAIHLLNGLYDAKMDHQPVVAIVGQQPRSSLGSNYIQDVDLKSLFKDVAHEYVNEAAVPGQIRHLLDRSFRIALAERTVTCLIIPSDLQDMPAQEKPKHEHGKMFSGTGYSSPRIVPEMQDLQSAADILNESNKVAILIGAGAMRAADEVVLTANKLGAGVAKALLGKAALPDDLPFVTGSIGMLGTNATHQMMSECDALLMIGSNFPYAEFLPKEGKARGVQIDIDARNLSLRYPMDVSLVGDSKETLSALLPLLQYKEDRAWRSKIEDSVSGWWKVVESRAMDPADPVNPQLLFWKLSDYIPENAIVSADSGTSAVWYARDLKLRSGMMGSVSGGLASMGCSVPYSIAAKFAFPERVPIAFVGDGAMQMNGNSELITIAKYWKQWADPRLVIVVLNNHDLSFVTWEMRVMAGSPKFEASQNLPDFPYAEYAASIGLRGIRVDSPEQIDVAWRTAFASDRPIVLDVHTDPNIPPLPPHITIEQAKAFATSMAKGEPDMPKPFLASLSQMMRGFLK